MEVLFTEMDLEAIFNVMEFVYTRFKAVLGCHNDSISELL